MPRIWIFIAAILESMAVIAGAIGAHLQSQNLAANLQSFETAQRSHALYALALFGVGLLLWMGHGRQSKWSAVVMNGAAGLLTLGILCFSGGIYLKVATGLETNPAVPFGGTCLIASWILLAASIWGVRLDKTGEDQIT